VNGEWIVYVGECLTWCHQWQNYSCISLLRLAPSILFYLRICSVRIWIWWYYIRCYNKGLCMRC